MGKSNNLSPVQQTVMKAKQRPLFGLLVLVGLRYLSQPPTDKNCLKFSRYHAGNLVLHISQCTVKKVSDIPVTSPDVTYQLFPPRESLVSDIPAGDGNVANLFFTVCGLGSTFSNKA
jgi:hypothetical protein